MTRDEFKRRYAAVVDFDHLNALLDAERAASMERAAKICDEEAARYTHVANGETLYVAREALAIGSCASRIREEASRG